VELHGLSRRGGLRANRAFPFANEEVPVIMSLDHIQAWHDYLVEQMYQRCSVPKEKALETVERWLHLLGQEAEVSVRPAIPLVAHIRNQRLPSQRLRAKSSIHCTRAAGTRE
jgi:hypothetical protein